MNREDIWRTLFARALEIIDAACAAGMPKDDWSFGGGTVLMLRHRHRHRFSRDIDIFLPEPQYLGFLTPRLNSASEPGMVDYLEQHGSIKIYYPEGGLVGSSRVVVDDQALAPKQRRPDGLKMLEVKLPGAHRPDANPPLDFLDRIVGRAQ